MNGKPSSPVLRGLGASNGVRLLDPYRLQRIARRQVNSELECEIYIGVGFDALARDRKPSVLLAHKQRTVVTKRKIYRARL
jgi:hypothetical protein